MKGLLRGSQGQLEPDSFAPHARLEDGYVRASRAGLVDLHKAKTN